MKKQKIILLALFVFSFFLFTVYVYAVVGVSHTPDEITCTIDFCWDSVNNRLGIGTTVPSSKFHVVGGGKFTGSLDMTSNKIENLLVPTASSDAVTKGYVDALMGGSSCPVEIESSNRTAATLIVASTTCRGLGGGWRLPTVEELSCFLGNSAGALLWTRTQSISVTNWIAVNPSSGVWAVQSANTNTAYRCVR